MLIEDARIRGLAEKIVTRLSADLCLRDDLMQECLLRMWRLDTEEPGHTESWYLQNCRFHLQHFLSAGRSVDSLKRATRGQRIFIDGFKDDLPVAGYHTNGELFELVSVRDLVSTLECHLRPREKAVLGALSDGFTLHDIALKLDFSYPTALKCRRKIAALTIKLGISPPPPYTRNKRAP